MDLDGDGRVDILTGSISGMVHYYRRKPNGTFAAGETLKRGFFKPVNVGPSSTVAVTDWDGDGNPDLIIGNGDGAVYWVRNVGTRQKPAWGEGERLRADGQAISADGGSAGPFIADWDGDGKPDLLLGSGSGRVVWFRNVGTKTKPHLAAARTLVEPMPRDRQERAASSPPPQRSAHNAKVCVADWNGDGRPDLLVGDYWTEKVGNEWKLHGWVWVYLRQTTAAQAVK